MILFIFYSLEISINNRSPHLSIHFYKLLSNFTSLFIFYYLAFVIGIDILLLSYSLFT